MEETQYRVGETLFRRVGLESDEPRVTMFSQADPAAPEYFFDQMGGRHLFSDFLSRAETMDGLKARADAEGPKMMAERAARAASEARQGEEG